MALKSPDNPAARDIAAYANPAIDAEGKIVVPDDVQDAIRTLLRWSGEDPSREGLLDTPKRVARAWRE